MAQPILEIKNLSIDFFTSHGTLRAVDNASLTLERGEILGIIGESGSGKTTLASGILQNVQAPGRVTEGEIIYYDENGNQTNLLQQDPKEFRKFRWANITTVFQAAQNVLNPSLRVRDHFIETVDAHESRISDEKILAKAKKLLSQVRLEERVLDMYPHQLSGGMKQRTIIALSLILEPELIILDEPTTALDVITQWYIMEILKQIHRDTGITMVFLTHDVSIIGSIVDRLAVMYAAHLVEMGPVDELFFNPMHMYTDGLLRAIPSLHDDVSKRAAIPGDPPNPFSPPPGCRFGPRCKLAAAGICRPETVQTDVMTFVGDHGTLCAHWEEVCQQNH